MKTGVDYLPSEEKTMFDMRVARIFTPAVKLAQLGAQATFGYEIYTDARIGQGGHKVEVSKIKTLDDGGNPINRHADLFRRLGLDETLQITDVLEGRLSIIGRRQLIPEEYEDLREIATRTNTGRKLLAEWDDVVLPYKCGLLSSFSLEARAMGPESVERRLELDVQDAYNASKRHDKVLIRQAVSALIGNRLTYGHLPIQE